ncbi:MAG TPA: alpha-glucan family phosphorylase [Gaiellaceae bacterium]
MTRGRSDSGVSSPAFAPGAADLAVRAGLLAERLSDGLKPLAPVAYNYVWSWLPDGAAVFRDINPHRWELSGANPVRFLNDLWPSTQEAVERNPELLSRIDALAEDVSAYLARPDRSRAGIDGTVAFFCAEFGLHVSLPIYSGGLGVLAGDILKEASDQALPMVAIGLFYRLGYFRQRIDITGRQQEYWLPGDPKSLPMARVTDDDGRPLHLTVDLHGEQTAFQVWRVDVGRVPLLLLDTELPENDPVQRWTSARLYESNRALRLAQYGLLGVGGARVLRALGIEPAAVHLNEGHPALAVLELATRQVEEGAAFEDALADVRRRVVFTTHTPVPAGNETYAADEFLDAFADLPPRLGIDGETFLDLCRIVPGDRAERPGMTALALRVSGRRNGVSRLHGEVARELWHSLFQRDAADVPIGHVTNGAHLPTFLGEPMYRLLTRHLGDGWLARAAEPATWEPVRAIPSDELWAARCESRERLLGFVRERSQQDGLRRGEQIEFVRAVARRLDPSVLTLGFARRLATYKRLHLMTLDPERAHRLLGGERPVQLLIAGKAHPADEPGKDTLQRLIGFKKEDETFAERVVFIDDYDLEVAGRLVSGCDVWVNLPRRPMEASGTSGMKATFNGVLQLSVLDGWWAEAYDGTNGWAIAGDESQDFDAADAHDAAEFYDLLEHEVIPLFYDRDERGVPQRWCERIKDALVTCAPAFTATRMVDDYAARMYPPESGAT